MGKKSADFLSEAIFPDRLPFSFGAGLNQMAIF
jgi:hypothetical protein